MLLNALTCLNLSCSPCLMICQFSLNLIQRDIVDYISFDKFFDLDKFAFRRITLTWVHIFTCQSFLFFFLKNLFPYIWITLVKLVCEFSGKFSESLILGSICPNLYFRYKILLYCCHILFYYLSITQKFRHQIA